MPSLQCGCEPNALDRSANRYTKPESSLYWPRIKHQTSDAHPWHTKATMRRTRDLKYVRRHGEQDELYDLRAAPRETRDVITDAAYAERLCERKERMLTRYQETCDVVPFDSDER